MSTNGAAARIAWASALLVAGGVLMAALWIIFTRAHGPTSFNEDRVVLGGSMPFWGMLLGGVPNLLVAAGLITLTPRTAYASARSARVGYVLLMIGLIVPALIDLSIQALGAPFFLPIAAIGLTLLAIGNRHNPRISRTSRALLLGVAALLAIAFAWALMPSALTDPIGGYRIYGALAHLGVGAGWVLFGISVLPTRTAAAVS
jgi:hypothetical protein